MSSVMETANLIKMLDCPVCQEIPEPPILMCLQGHSICHKCRVKVTECPVSECQAEFSTARNLLAEQLILTLHRKCPYSKEGCSLTIAAKDWESHLASCDFRQVDCDLQQGKTCQGTKMNYRTYFKHLQNVHGVQGIKGTVLNVTQFVTYEQSRLQSEMPRGVWPVQFLEAFNEIFLTGTAVVGGKIYWWIYILGGEDVSRNYVTKISITLKSKGYELSWIGPVHSFRTSPASILQQGMCLLATTETLYPFTHVKMQQIQGKLLASQEGQPNLGWNITFSLVKREKATGSIQTPPSRPTMQLLTNEKLPDQLASLKLEPSQSQNGFKVKEEPAEGSSKTITILKQEPNSSPQKLTITREDLIRIGNRNESVFVKQEPEELPSNGRNAAAFHLIKQELMSPLPTAESTSKSKRKMKKGKSTSQLNMFEGLSD